MKKFSYLFLIDLLSGCANDFEYRFVNPDTCIEVSKTATTCTEDQAKAKEEQLAEFAKAVEFESRNKRSRS